MNSDEERLKEIARYERNQHFVRQYEDRVRKEEEKTARVQAAWDKYIVPVLEEHGFKIEPYASGWEVDGSALYVKYNNEWAYLYQEGDM